MLILIAPTSRDGAWHAADLAQQSRPATRPVSHPRCDRGDVRRRRPSRSGPQHRGVLAAGRGIPHLACVAWRTGRPGHPDHRERAVLCRGHAHQFLLVEPLRAGPARYLRDPDRGAGQPGCLPAHWAKTQPDPRVVTSMQFMSPLWMLLSALLAGLVVTLLFLGSMGIAGIPGCGPAGMTVAQLPGGCFGLARGYPMRFLAAYQGTPVINQLALVMDWAQWSLVSLSTLYLLRLPGQRPRPLSDQPSAAQEPSAI